MYKVTFDSPVSSCEDCQTVFKAEHIEPCVDFASALHRSSNVPHTIEVVRYALIIPSKDEVCLTLVLKENSVEHK